MAFWGDYHTHTIYSHGKNGVYDNVAAAKAAGLKEVAITDHGLKHFAFNLKRSKIKQLMSEIESANQKFCGLRVYLGIEANLRGYRSGVDIEDGDKDWIELLLCGYHKAVRPKNVGDLFSFTIGSVFYDLINKTPAKRIIKNTDLYIKAIEQYPIDVITHLNYGFKTDAVQIGRAAKAYGVHIELNGKRNMIPDSDLEKMLGEGVSFICNSDAHTAARVGDMSLPVSIIERLNIPYANIANWERLPVFRSRANNAGDGQ